MYLQFTVNEYDRLNNHQHSSQIIKIMSARKQVAAGIKYTIEVEISQITD